MNSFKVGCNFSFDLLDAVRELNEKYFPHKISELYGSERHMAFLTARPDFRLPEISRKHLETYIQTCNDIDVSFNYTMNTIHPGTKQELEIKKNEIQDFVQYLEDIGVNRITVASPLLMEFIREVSNIKLEVSTIAHIDAITQIKYFKEVYGVDKICGNLMKNRAFDFLQKAARWCNENDVIYEIMVNEFCGVAQKNYTTHCIYRDSCYIQHSVNKTKEDALLFGNYPMGNCISARATDPYNWLRTRFVRPEDLFFYNAIGISHFKVTGRTGTTEYLRTMAEAYLSENWEGNVLYLWKQLETIYNDENELSFQTEVNLDNKKLDGFLNHWFDDFSFDCANEVCGETCTYCADFYEKRMKN